MKYPRSAYLHIPFCHRRCFYCDFPVVPLGDKARGDEGTGSLSIQSYLKLLYREISLVPKVAPLSTVYVGGGTPSILSPDQIGALLDKLQRHFGFQPGAEITMEVDPASFCKEKLRDYLEAGINRLSLGAQSFHDQTLQKLGRRHSSIQLFEACEWLDEFFQLGDLSTWSIDLIQNLPSKGVVYWKDQLEKVINTSAPHLSIYDLSIEEGTVFSWLNKRGELLLPSDDLSSSISYLTSQVLQEKGFARYEISNFALPGHTSRHNRVYWSGAGWWGFGLGATSCPWGKRFLRPRTRTAYKEWVQKQELEGLEESLKLSSQTVIDMDELFLVGLRRREGVNLHDLAKLWGWNDDICKKHFDDLLNRWKPSIERGLIKQIGRRFFLSDPEGMELSNQILVDMLLWWESLPASAVVSPKS